MRSGRPPAVVTLDGNRRSSQRTDTLDDVGVERALAKPASPIHLLGGVLEDFDKDSTNDLSLLLGVVHTSELTEEAILRRDVNKLDVVPVGEVGADLLGLSVTQEAVVYKDACAALADGAPYRSDHRGVDAPRKFEYDSIFSDLLPNRDDLFLEEVPHVQFGDAPQIPSTKFRSTRHHAGCEPLLGGTALRKCRRRDSPSRRRASSPELATA